MKKLSKKEWEEKKSKELRMNVQIWLKQIAVLKRKQKEMNEKIDFEIEKYELKIIEAGEVIDEENKILQTK